MVEFRTAPPMRLTIVDAPWDPPGPVTAVAPRPVDVASLASWLRRAYPTGDIQIRRGTLPTFDHQPNCNEVNAALLQWAGGVFRRPNRFYAMYSDNGGGVIGGCIIKHASGDDAFGSGFGSGPAGAPQPDFAAWDTDASYADAYGGHEIAHQYFRLHPGFANNAAGACTDGEQNEADTAFPYASGLIGNTLYDNQAIDAGDATLDIELTLGDWRTGWHDFMSYCDNQWPSAYTYTAIMKYMCGGDGISYCLNVPQVKRPADAGAAPVPGAARKGGPRLLVTGPCDVAASTSTRSWCYRGSRLPNGHERAATRSSCVRPAGRWPLATRSRQAWPASGRAAARHSSMPSCPTRPRPSGSRSPTASGCSRRSMSRRTPRRLT